MGSLTGLSGLAGLSSIMGSPVVINAATASVFNSADISISNVTWTTLTFDTVIWDSASIYDAGNPERLTAPVDGYYLAIGQVLWNPTAEEQLYMEVRTSDGVRVATRGIGSPSNAGLTCVQIAAGICYLSTGIYVYMRATSSPSAGATIGTSAKVSPILSMYKLL